MIIIKDISNFHRYLAEAFVGDRIEEYQNDPIFYAKVNATINFFVDLLENYDEENPESYRNKKKEEMIELKISLLNSGIKEFFNNKK